MYDFILLALTGLVTLLGYLFASRLITTSLINSSSYHFSRFYRTDVRLNFRDLFCYILSNLKEFENILIPRLAVLVSQSWKMDKLMIKWGIAISKLCQSILVIALFLPFEYFALFLIALVLVQVFLRDYSIRFLGTILGFLLAKSCIEFALYIFAKYVPDASLIIPGSYYFKLVLGQSWGIPICGALFAFLANSFTIVLPVLLVLSFIFKFSSLQCLLLLIGFYAGSFVRRYLFSNFVSGFFFAYLREDSAFYFLLTIALAIMGLISGYTDPEFLHRTVGQEELSMFPLMIFVATLLALPIFILIDFFRIPYYRQEGGGDGEKKEKRYKYPLKLFRETPVGLQVVMNELKNYAADLYAYIEKSREWIDGIPLRSGDVEALRKKFSQRSSELKRYLDLILLSQEIKFYEQEAISCVEFHDGTNALHDTLYEKLKLLSGFEDLKKIENSKLFFLNMIEAEDAVFLLYKEVLKHFDEEDVKNLFKVLGHKETIFQESQEAYTTTYGETSNEESRKLASELTRLYQIDLWQIHHLLELLGRR